MKNFYTDTQDAIELKWKDVVCKKFPEYASFWNEFIGVRTTRYSGILLPYKYKLPKGWTKEKREQFASDFEQICITHYSIFCNLAGAHFQQENCPLSLNREIQTEMHFLYWEAMECCYQHLGNVTNYFSLFWYQIFALTGNQIPKQENGDLDKRKVSNETEKVFRKQKKYTFFKKIKKEFGRGGQMIIIRNNIIHFSHFVNALWVGAGYSLPYRISSNMKFMKKGRSTGILAHKKAENHISEVETLLNESEKVTISYIRNYLQNEGITIQY